VDKADLIELSHPVAACVRERRGHAAGSEVRRNDRTRRAATRGLVPLDHDDRFIGGLTDVPDGVPGLCLLQRGQSPGVAELGK